jgi:sirohydrochlorin cobaltochelatase
VRGKTLHYCLPVGVHPSMTSLILRRAREVAPEIDPAETTLIITGHGTGLNQNSTKAIRDQVDLIAAPMPATPPCSTPTWRNNRSSPSGTKWPHPVCDRGPLFHLRWTALLSGHPVLLGIEPEVGPAASQRDVFRHNPHHLRGKTLFYSSAIGTERSSPMSSSTKSATSI